MKHKPHSKLPFKIAIFDNEKYDICQDYKELFDENAYLIGDAENNVVGTLEHAGDIEYIEDACNNYQEAVELLTRLKEDSMCSVVGDELIEEFLKKINDE